MIPYEPVVSIILPCRDADPLLLARAVDSVLAQQYSQFELLIVDDGSDAVHADTLTEISGRDPRIRLIRQAAAGVSAARNLGFREARGEYVTLLDADDTLSRGFLREAVSTAKALRADYLIGGTYYVYASQAGPCVEREQAKDSTAGAIALTPGRLHRTKAECIGAPYRFDGDAYINRGIAARLIRKDVLTKELYFPENLRIAEDASWNLKLVCAGLRGYYVPGIWYYYYENAKSVSNSYNPNVIKDMEDHLEVIGRQMDLRSGIEYKAYLDLMMDDLRYIYKCLLGHPAYRAARNERRELQRHLYRDEPWRMLASPGYRRVADHRNRFKADLYRLHLLFDFWSLRKGV